MSQILNLYDLLTGYDSVAIDTCAILNEGFIPLLAESAKQISKSERAIIIHSSVINEIIRFSQNPYHNQYETSKRLLPILYELERAKIVKFEGNYWDFRLADQQFLEFIIDGRQNKTIAIITLDKDLSADIMLQNQINSFYGYPAVVFTLGKDKNLYRYRSIVSIRKKVATVEKYKKLFHIL